MIKEVYKIDGTPSGQTIELNDDVFGIKPNDHVLFLSVKRYLANQRQGTHKAKERSEVRGGGKKPWRQKGRGGARAGTSRSPLWVGGGSIFGPRPRDYRENMPKKVVQLARKSALSYKVKDEQFTVIQDLEIEVPKTKEFAAIIAAFKFTGKKLLIVTGSNKEKVYKAGRNIDKVTILPADAVAAYQILNNQMVIFEQSAVEYYNKIFTSDKETVV